MKPIDSHFRANAIAVDKAAADADLIDTEVNDMDATDVKNRSDEQCRDDPDDDEDDDGAALSRVELLAASGRRLHRQVVVDTERR